MLRNGVKPRKTRSAVTSHARFKVSYPGDTSASFADSISAHKYLQNGSKAAHAEKPTLPAAAKSNIVIGQGRRRIASPGATTRGSFGGASAAIKTYQFPSCSAFASLLIGLVSEGISVSLPPVSPIPQIVLPALR